MDDSVAKIDGADDAQNLDQPRDAEVFEGDLDKLDKHARRELFRRNICRYTTKLGRAAYEAFK